MYFREREGERRDPSREDQEGQEESEKVGGGREGQTHPRRYGKLVLQTQAQGPTTQRWRWDSVPPAPSFSSRLFLPGHTTAVRGLRGGASHSWVVSAPSLMARGERVPQVQMGWAVEPRAPCGCC